MKQLTKVLLKRLSRAARPYLQSSGLLQVSGVYNHSAMAWQPGAEKTLVLARSACPAIHLDHTASELLRVLESL